jgi:ABC-type cobalamin transport system permease subunit
VHPPKFLGLVRGAAYFTVTLASSVAVVLFTLHGHSLASFPLGTAAALATLICVTIYFFLYTRRRAMTARLTQSSPAQDSIARSPML